MGAPWMLIVCWFTLATLALGLVAVVADPSSRGPFGRLSKRLRVTLPMVFLHLIGTTCGRSAQEGAARQYSFVAMLACVSVFLVCCASDPGVVTPKNWKLFCETFAYDNLIYYEDMSCDVCKVPSPARSRHCRLCNQCVLRFDHHCIWIGNCVGAKNYRYFLLFLFMHALLCGYGAFVGASLLLSIIDRKRLFSVTLIDTETGSRVRPTPLLVLQYLLGNCTELVLLSTLCALAGLSLCFFLGMHSILLLRNKTTNEVVKYRELSRFLRSLPAQLDNPPLADASLGSAALSEAVEKPSQSVLRRSQKVTPSQSIHAYGGPCGVAPKEAANEELARIECLDEPRTASTKDNFGNQSVPRSNFITCSAVRWVKRLPRSITAQQAAAAFAASRKLYDRGLTENCREVFCFEQWVKEEWGRRRARRGSAIASSQ